MCCFNKISDSMVNKIISEIFELIDECHGAMLPNEYDSIILSIFLLKYLNCKFEKRYNCLIEEGQGFEDDVDDYLIDGTIYLYPKSRWNAVAYQENKKEFAFSLINALKFIEDENPQFNNISGEIPLKIDNHFYKGFMIIVEGIENDDEIFWLDLYKSYLNIFKDTKDVSESFIKIADVI